MHSPGGVNFESSLKLWVENLCASYQLQTWKQRSSHDKSAISWQKSEPCHSWSIPFNG